MQAKSLEKVEMCFLVQLEDDFEDGGDVLDVLKAAKDHAVWALCLVSTIGGPAVKLGKV